MLRAAALPECPARSCDRGLGAARRGRLGRAIAHHHGEAVRHRPRQRDRAQRHAARDLRRESDLPHRPLPRQGSGAEHPRVPVRQRPLRTDLEPPAHRPHPDRRSRDAVHRAAHRVLRGDRRLPGHGGHPSVPGAGVHGDGTADRARAPADHLGEEQGVPLTEPDRTDAEWCAGNTTATSTSREFRANSETETFIALRCEIDNWRWAGVPFYLRTGKRLAEGARIVSIAFREPPRSMFPAGSEVGGRGSDHLTFDLAERVEALAVVLREASRSGHDPRQAESPVSRCAKPAAAATCSRPTSD